MGGTTQRAARSGVRREFGADRAGGGNEAEPKADRCEAADVRLAGLVSTIEREIIPRLVLAHRSGDPPLHAVVVGAGELESSHVAELCGLVIRSDLDVVLRYVQRTRERGVPLERIYLELLAPVARRLGEMWLADECDFTTVTLGLWRLHQVLHELSPSFQLDHDPIAEGKRALLAATPGEQHTFGLFMVAEFFRRDGWDVVDGPAFSARELAAAVRHDWFSVAGFSLSREESAGQLAALIRDVRQASRNRGIGIIVGGVVFVDHPDLVAQVGADGSAADGREAVRLAESMLTPRQQRGAG
jgi:MerR family transcriptional regulator, light-induced transcriptional regulator